MPARSHQQPVSIDQLRIGPASLATPVKVSFAVVDGFSCATIRRPKRIEAKTALGLRHACALAAAEHFRRLTGTRPDVAEIHIEPPIRFERQGEVTATWTTQKGGA